MIILTRFNGQQFAVNPDLIERVQANPDTTLGMLDGTSHVVKESLPEVIERIRDWKAGVLIRARELAADPERPSLRVLPTTPTGK